MAAVPSATLDALRHAARGGGERYLIGIVLPGERRRIAAAMAAEGEVIEAPSTAEALRRMRDEPFDLTVLDLEEVTHGHDPLAAARELRPLSDVVFLMEGDPTRCGEAFSRDAAAVLPRPLPEADALLRAHLRWLASSRRSRTRGRMLQSAFATHREALLREEPAIAAALDALLAGGPGEPTVAILGDAALAQAAGAGAGAAQPDALVLGLDAADDLQTRLGEARTRAPGAAVIVVDGGPTPERLGGAIFGGVRAYLPRAQLPALGRTVASVATRRRAETLGRKLVETLARFGVLDGAEGTRAGPTVGRDVDPKLMTESADAGAPVVPTAHEVLVVDDEVVVLSVLREALKRGGYRVTTAASAEEAIELMQQRRFDLVLTDKNLPGASGLDVLRAARVLSPAPAIVLITGYSSYDSAVQALDIGAHDYIEKPIRDVEDLRFRIRRALSRREEELSRRRMTPTGRKGKVLIVEAEGPRRKLMTDYLGQSYSVTAVADGDEALRLLEGERYDVVLADRNLPGVSGMRVIEQAQRLLPHCASVLYTAYPSYESVKDAFEVGADAFLARPAEDLKKLGEKIAEALGGRGGILLG